MWAKLLTILKDLAAIILLLTVVAILLCLAYSYDNCHKYEAIARQQAEEMAGWKVEADLQRNLRIYERKQNEHAKPINARRGKSGGDIATTEQTCNAALQ